MPLVTRFVHNVCVDDNLEWELASRFYLYVCVKGNLEMALVTRLYTMSVYRETLR